MDTLLLIAFQLFFISCITYSMISDFRNLRIPNWVSIALLIGFIPYAIIYWETIRLSDQITYAAIVFGVTFILFVINMFGAGDVKILSAITLWTPPHLLAALLLSVAFLGGILALTLIIMKYFLKSKELSEIKNTAFRRIARFAKKGAMPYGIPIGLAALLIIPANLG